MKVEVYNLESGEMAIVEAVDATEYIKNGGWSKSPPPKKKIKKVEEPVKFKTSETKKE